MGYSINVYQETINKTIKEYLVNFDYLIKLMDDYGFIPLPEDEAKELGFKSGVGSFSEIYRNLEHEIKRKPYMKKDIGDSLNMSVGEKRISYYNKYFIFKKIRIVDAKQIGRNESISQEQKNQGDMNKLADKLTKEVNPNKTKKPKNKSKKRRTKLKLVTN